jgi:hypothetical protein
MLGNLLPFYSPGKTVDDLLREQIASELSNSSSLDLSKLNPALQQQINQQTQNLNSQLLS